MQIFLDSSVLIQAVERPKSPSARTLDRVLAREVKACVDELVVGEVEEFFRARRGRAFAWRYTELIRRVARVVTVQAAARRLPDVSAKYAPRARIHRAAALAAEVDQYVVDPSAQIGGSDDLGPGLYGRADFIRSLAIAVVVGLMLFFINTRPGAFAASPVDPPDIARAILNFLVPFTVASVSVMLANGHRAHAGA